MADYQKMYAVLCTAVDDVIGPLEKIPMAIQPVRTLREALLRAEDINMDTSMYAEKDENGKEHYNIFLLFSLYPMPNRCL